MKTNKSLITKLITAIMFLLGYKKDNDEEISVIRNDGAPYISKKGQN